MGSWVTLHLLNDNKLMNEIIPSISLNTKEFRENVSEYLSFFHTGGTNRLNEDQLLKLISRTSTNILETSNKLNLVIESVAEHKQLKVTESLICEIGNTKEYRDFGRFFEYLVFNTCADFFPYISLGKAGISRFSTQELNTLTNSIIETHKERSFIYSCDGAGVECLIPAEDAELLYYCIEERKEDGDEFMEAILNMLEIANKNKLGLVVGRDLREEPLTKLPQNKNFTESEWIGMTTQEDKYLKNKAINM